MHNIWFAILGFYPEYNSQIILTKEVHFAPEWVVHFTPEYSIYKELERLLRLNGINLSAEKAIEQIKEIKQLKYVLPKSLQVKTQILQPSKLQSRLL